MNKFISLAGFLLLVFIISGVSSLVTMPAVTDWYQTLNKPSWTPPAWVFGPVWTILYIMIAISGWRVWRKFQPSDFLSKLMHPIMQPYWLQLFLNFLWSIIFFGLKLPLPAAIDIIAMLIVIAINIRAFYMVDRIAAYLLIPYFLWVSYASTLNIGIVALN